MKKIIGKAFKESVITLKEAVIKSAFLSIICYALIVFVPMAINLAINLKIITPIGIQGNIEDLENLNWALITQNLLCFGLLILLTTEIFKIVKPLVFQKKS